MITIWDPADPVPNYPPYAFLVDSPFALGQDLNGNLHKEWATSCGDDSSSPSLACGEVKLTVKAVGPDGEDRQMFIRVGEDGKIISEGFAPFEFKGVQGNTYQVRATNFGDLVFDRWADDGSTDRHRMVTLDADLELTAKYKKAAAGTDTFETQLSGSEEVPPVNTQATGKAEFGVSENGTELSYKVSVTSIDKVSMAHLHVAPVGVNRPVVVTLYNEAPGGAVDGVLAEGTIKEADLTGPLAGMTVAELVDEIKAGKMYANVHTTDYPDGEIRGQLE